MIKNELCPVSDFRQSVLQNLRKVVISVPIRGRFRIGRIVSSALVPNGKVALSHIEGRQMVFDFRNPHEVSMYFDLFAPELSLVMRNVLERGDVFIDCGANIGYYSCLASSLVGHEGKVYSIDANPFCVERIRQSKAVGDYTNMEIIQCAIGETMDDIEFNLADDPMYSSLANLNELNFTKTQSTISVPLRTLDDILSPYHEAQRIRLIKMDIEGAEIDAIRGAETTLDKQLVDYIYVEVHAKQLQLRGQNPNDVLGLLSTHGFKIKRQFGQYAYLYQSDALGRGHINAQS